MPPVCSSSDPESFCKSVDVELKLLFIIMNYYFNEAFNKKGKNAQCCVCFFFPPVNDLLGGDFTSFTKTFKNTSCTRELNLTSNETPAETLYAVSPGHQRRGP